MLLSYLLGRAAATARKSLCELLGLRVLALLALVLAAGLGTITNVAAMAEGAAGGVDWFLLAWLWLAAVTVYIIGNDHQVSERRTIELNIGKWLSISISGIALVLLSVLLTSQLLQLLDTLSRNTAAQTGELRKTPQARSPEAFREALKRQEVRRKEEVKKYLKERDSRASEPAKVAPEEKSDPRRYSGWQLEPSGLIPPEIPDLAPVSSTPLGDNMFEAIFIPHSMAGAGDEASGDSIEVVIVVSKQESPGQAQEYLEPVLAQYGFSAGGMNVESREVRFGFQGGTNGKTDVYQQAFIGWTSSLFSFEVVARTSGSLVTDKALLYGPALQAAVATLRRAEPAIAASKSTH